MTGIMLVTPEKRHEAEALAYVKEHFSNGEHVLHGTSLLETMDTYDLWLNHLDRQSKEETAREGWVVSSTFFAIDKSTGMLVGVIDIRHELNAFLAGFGGHIGYGVRPSQRRKGYATEILRLGLEFCKTIGLKKVMLACYKDNVASGKIIQKNGGILEKEFTYSDGGIVQVYWITL